VEDVVIGERDSLRVLLDAVGAAANRYKREYNNFQHERLWAAHARMEEQAERVAALEAENARLTARVKELEEEVAGLRKGYVAAMEEIDDLDSFIKRERP
jgi:predicted nuclease with TOPRIM domain